MNWLICLKWDPCERQERREKGVFRAAHPHTLFLGQCPPWGKGAPRIYCVHMREQKKKKKDGWKDVFLAEEPVTPALHLGFENIDFQQKLFFYQIRQVYRVKLDVKQCKILVLGYFLEKAKTFGGYFWNLCSHTCMCTPLYLSDPPPRKRHTLSPTHHLVYSVQQNENGGTICVPNQTPTKG